MAYVKDASRTDYQSYDDGPSRMLTGKKQWRVDLHYTHHGQGENRALWISSFGGCGGRGGGGFAWGG